MFLSSTLNKFQQNSHFSISHFLLQWLRELVQRSPCLLPSQHLILKILMTHWNMTADAIIRRTIVRVLLFKKNQTNQNSAISSGGHSSVILRTSCGLLYPIPRSIRSPQIEIYQSGLRLLTLVNFRSAADIAQWFDKFLEDAMMINMHEFFYWTCYFCYS